MIKKTNEAKITMSERIRNDIFEAFENNIHHFELVGYSGISFPYCARSNVDRVICDIVWNETKKIFEVNKCDYSNVPFGSFWRSIVCAGRRLYKVTQKKIDGKMHIYCDLKITASNLNQTAKSIYNKAITDKEYGKYFMFEKEVNNEKSR